MRRYAAVEGWRCGTWETLGGDPATTLVTGDDAEDVLARGTERAGHEDVYVYDRVSRAWMHWTEDGFVPREVQP